MKLIFFILFVCSFGFSEFHNEGGSGNWVVNEFKSKIYRVLAMECRRPDAKEFVTALEKILTNTEVINISGSNLKSELLSYPFASITKDKSKTVLHLNQEKWGRFFDLDMHTLDIVYDALVKVYELSENKTMRIDEQVYRFFYSKEQLNEISKYPEIEFRDGAIRWFFWPGFKDNIEVDVTCEGIYKTKWELPTVENVKNSLKKIQENLLKHKWLTINNYQVVLSLGDRTDKTTVYDLLEGKPLPHQNQKDIKRGVGLICVSYP